MNANLGIGVSVESDCLPVLHSEHELLSQAAFLTQKVRKSLQGIGIQGWIPVPLNRHHWNNVKPHAIACLKEIHNLAGMGSPMPGYVDVFYHLMNTIVVRFSAEAEKQFKRPDTQNILSDALEKAIGAYYKLFHLLLCLATEDPAIVASANKTIARFIAGPRLKVDFPDLGHVIITAMVSDAGLTEELTLLVIKEAILRNVVWMLDAKGAGMAELAYLEPSPDSQYRLTMTFNASLTSYRLLMFQKLFSSAARPPRKGLTQLRDSLFDSESAPPSRASASITEGTREIHEISNFPSFLKMMGIKQVPPKSVFTAFLRRTIMDSVDVGYSTMPMTQSQLYLIRRRKERYVQRSEDVRFTSDLQPWFEYARVRGWPSFFPK